MTLRRHYLPDEPDDIDSLARAIWLDSEYWEKMRIAVGNGIALALSGKK
ncbi:DUF6890 family protein [Limnobaculum xujianqingii]|nr:hypothetical protein [Limnobaculum xujianqingii]